MTSTLAVLALTLALASQAVPQNPTAPDAPGARLEVDLVALDRKGTPLTDLRPEEVEVWIERYRIPVEALIALTPDDERRRRSIILLLDDMTLNPALVARAREAARRFVDTMAPGDRMAITMLSGSSLKVTEDRAELLRQLNSYNVRATPVMRIDEFAAHVLRSFASLSRQMQEWPGHRKTIVAIGSSWLFDTPIPPAGIAGNLRPEWTDAVRAMALANAVLYVIDPGGVGASRVAASAGFARDTGGHAFTNTNDLTGAAERIMRESETFYIVRFADPPVFRGAPLRELDVRVLRRDTTVRARRLIPGGAAVPVR